MNLAAAVDVLKPAIVVGDATHPQPGAELPAEVAAVVEALEVVGGLR
jgi:hypothetical protein